MSARLEHHTIYLSAPVNALVEGLFEENVPFSQVKKHGDFGIGTFNDLDGEMVMLDGTVYQCDSEGRIHVIDESALTPFACVTFFKPLTHDEIPMEMEYGAFVDFLNGLLPSPNLFYAIRVDGEFAGIRTRSVHKQENYRPLVDVAKDQALFSFSNIRGTLAGFFTPPFVSSLSVPGLHLHFLSEDFRHGGHLLECRPIRARVGVQILDRVELSLPMTLDYLLNDFSRDVGRDLNQAEK